MTVRGWATRSRGNPKREIRNKSKCSKFQSTNSTSGQNSGNVVIHGSSPFSSSGFRVSYLFRISSFGFGISPGPLSPKRARSLKAYPSTLSPASGERAG